MIRKTSLILLLSFQTLIIFDSFSFDPGDEVPGILIVNFESGAINHIEIEKAFAVDTNSVKVPEVLDSLNSIKADSLEKLFKMSFEKDTLVYSSLKGQYVNIPDLSQFLIVYFDSSIDLDTALLKLDILDETLSVEKGYVVSECTFPTDSMFVDSSQWYLNNFFAEECDIGAPEAWDIVTCPDTIKIAVVDDGARQTHNDLYTLWDLDTTIVIYDADGDSIENDTLVLPHSYFEARDTTIEWAGRHGTRVCGLVAAKTNNDTTMAGVAWGAKIQCKAGAGGRRAWHYAPEIRYAAWTGAHIISNSWTLVDLLGPDTSSCPTYISLPVEAAYNIGCIIVASYGNEGNGPMQRPYKSWPAQLDEVISVGALTPTFGRDSVFCAPYQNWYDEEENAQILDITAPGDSMTSCYINNDWSRHSFKGTSAAAPIVSGVVALILSRFPNLIGEPDSVKEVLTRSAVWFDNWGDSLQMGWNDEWVLSPYCYGAGMVNAYHAVAPPYNATAINRAYEDAPDNRRYPKLRWILSTSPDAVNYRIKAEYFDDRLFDHSTYYYPDIDDTIFVDSSFTLPDSGYDMGEFVVYSFSTVDYSGLRSIRRVRYFGDPTIAWPVDFAILNENTVWDDMFARIPDSLIIPEGVSLSLVNGTKVLFDGGEDNRLIVEGELIIEGSDGNEISLVKDTSETSWGGIIQRLGDGASSPGKITINYCEIEDAEVGIHAIDTLNEDNRISHVTFTDCDWGIYQDSTELDVDSCEFVGGEKGIYVNDVATASDISEYHGNTFDDVDIGIHGDNSVVYIYDCDISNTTDEGIYLDDCDNSLISNVTVDSAGSYGIYIKYSNNVTIDTTESTYNDESGLYFYESGGTVYWSDFTDNTKSGVRCNNSSPTISSCIISDNGTHGLSCTSSAQPSLYQRNTLEDNAGYQFATTYKYFPVTNNGLNNIFCAGNNTILNYTSASKPHFDYPCTNNYWGGPSIDPYKLFYSYNPADTIMYVYYPPAGSQYQRSAQKRALSTYDDSLSAAFAHESLREWSDASRIFYWIAVNDSSDFNRSTAILHWLHDDNADSAGWAARLGSLEEIEDDLDEDSELFEPVGDASARCLVGAQRWNDAISIYTDRMENALDLNDSLIAEIHIGAIYVNWAGALNSPERPGGRRKAAPGNPVEPETSFDPTEWETLEYQLSKTSTVSGSQDWKPVSRAAYEKRVREILAILDKQAHTDEALALLPTKYELSAPYPNPFNPSVVVPFALPENTKLRLVIFDILGREVVELADRNIQAGYHRVVWDGKNSAGIPVASGVYIVRLESDKFTAVKKAVMIK